MSSKITDSRTFKISICLLGIVATVAGHGCDPVQATQTYDEANLQDEADHENFDEKHETVKLVRRCVFIKQGMKKHFNIIPDCRRLIVQDKVCACSEQEREGESITARESKSLGWYMVYFIDAFEGSHSLGRILQYAFVR